MKVKLDYTVRTTRAPGETTDTWTPMIVDRLQPTGLESVIEKCIDRGLITGIKTTAAKTIADGVAEQLAYEFGQGRGIQFGQYFYGRPYLSGQVDGNGRLTSENSIDVRLYKGNAFKLSRDDFELSFIEGGNNPTISFLVCDGAYPRGDIAKDTNVKLNGKMLYGAGDTVKVKFVAEDGASAAVEVSVFTALSTELIAFPCPNGLLAGKKYLVSVERTDANGVVRVSATKPITVIPGAPTITEAGTTGEGEGDGYVNVRNSTLEVRGANLETVTSIDLLDDEGDLWHSVPATLVDDRLTAHLDFTSTPSEEGSLRVTTASGSATYDVTYGND